MVINASSSLVSNVNIIAVDLVVNLTVREFTLFLADNILSNVVYIYDVVEISLISGYST